MGSSNASTEAVSKRASRSADWLIIGGRADCRAVGSIGDPGLASSSDALYGGCQYALSGVSLSGYLAASRACCSPGVAGDNRFCRGIDSRRRPWLLPVGSDDICARQTTRGTRGEAEGQGAACPSRSEWAQVHVWSCWPSSVAGRAGTIIKSSAGGGRASLRRRNALGSCRLLNGSLVPWTNGGWKRSWQDGGARTRLWSAPATSYRSVDACAKLTGTCDTGAIQCSNLFIQYTCIGSLHSGARESTARRVLRDSTCLRVIIEI